MATVDSVREFTLRLPKYLSEFDTTGISTDLVSELM